MYVLAVRVLAEVIMFRGANPVDCNYVYTQFNIQCLQCFDAVGWMTGRASGL